MKNEDKRSISIRNKLKLTIIGFSLLILVIFTLAITFTSYFYFHKKTQVDLKILAEVFSHNVSASVIFNDPPSAMKILSTLKENPHILKAIILKDGKDFASYPGNQSIDKNEQKNTGIWLLNGNYYISVPIVVTNQIIGNLILVSDLKEWNNIEKNLYRFFIVMVIILILMTYAISRWLEFQITKPLQEISDWAKHITKTHNFSTRVYKNNFDEIGSLVDSLNAMLSDLVKQESILALNKKLTKEVNERGKVEMALVAMRDQADIANKAKSLFLANMSHEIRTPLNGIIGMTHFLSRTKLDSVQSEYTRTIQQSGQALLVIINEILDFSKIESGSIHLEKIDFNLRLLVEETIEMLAPLAYDKGLAIGALVQLNVPMWINGDPTRLRQILTNILGNAIKFTDIGDVGLNVSLVSSQNNGEVILRFEIIDSGIGIKSNVRSRLFKTFSQGDATTSRKYGGTGLGLVISKRLVELMEGQIDVENVEPRGSKFWFTIHATLASPKKTHKDVVSLPNLYGLRVLCVDDNSMSRRNVVQQAESWGMSCDTTENGFEAIAKLRTACSLKNPYAICIIEYAIPMISGLHLVEEIQKSPEISHTPLIMMIPLGYTIPEEESQRLGIKYCITKPVRQSVLFETIMAILGSNTKGQKEISVESSQTQGVSAHEATALHEYKSARILLAEDNSVNQYVVLCMLEALGCKADVVESGLEVLVAVKKTTYDLILMDCQMPEMDGYAATHEIRKLEQANHTKRATIIAMTANAVMGDREKCVEAGMDDYISKPFDMTRFEQMLKHWLKQI